MSEKKFNHMYLIAFSVDSDKEDASDVTHEDLIAGILERVADVIARREWDEAVGPPEETFEWEEED